MPSFEELYNDITELHTCAILEGESLKLAKQLEREAEDSFQKIQTFLEQFNCVANHTGSTSFSVFRDSRNSHLFVRHLAKGQERIPLEGWEYLNDTNIIYPKNVKARNLDKKWANRQDVTTQFNQVCYKNWPDDIKSFRPFSPTYYAIETLETDKGRLYIAHFPIENPYKGPYALYPKGSTHLSFKDYVALKEASRFYSVKPHRLEVKLT